MVNLAQVVYSHLNKKFKKWLKMAIEKNKTNNENETKTKIQQSHV